MLRPVFVLLAMLAGVPVAVAAGAFDRGGVSMLTGETPYSTVILDAHAFRGSSVPATVLPAIARSRGPDASAGDLSQWSKCLCGGRTAESIFRPVSFH